MITFVSMEKKHHYNATIRWTGNQGTGTSGYADYTRSHTVNIKGKPELFCSSDVPFRGDGSLHNPEDFFLTAIASCHMLWYLHLCADAGVIVTSYIDHPEGILEQNSDGSGRFTGVDLHPYVEVSEASMLPLAAALHEKAHQKCFMANSCNFPVRHRAVIGVNTPE